MNTTLLNWRWEEYDIKYVFEGKICKNWLIVYRDYMLYDRLSHDECLA